MLKNPKLSINYFNYIFNVLFVLAALGAHYRLSVFVNASSNVSYRRAHDK